MQSFSPFKRFIQQCSLFVVFICCGILFMSCSSSGGSSSSSTTSGTVVDPPISGATVFCDTNGNFVLDDGELRTTSDENGEYLLSDTCPKGTSVVAIGGIDTVTGEENVLLSKECMTDSGDCGMITPFSSIYDLTPPENRENLVANYFGDGITPDQALNTDFHKTCEQSGDSDSDHCKMYQKNMEIAVILSGALTAMDESLSGSGITDTVAMKHVFAGISEKIMDHDDSSSNFEFDERLEFS
jgi:hypothetical protein